MSDSLDESGVELLGIQLDPATYDESPVALYVYRQRRGDASYIGVVGDVAVQAVADGRVRGHEAVHPQRVEALVWHHETTQAPPALVTLLHRAGPVFMRTVEEVQRTPPLLDFAGPGGLQQTVWRLSEGPATAALVSELAAADFYIADGHHRVAAALEEWRLAASPRTPVCSASSTRWTACSCRRSTAGCPAPCLGGPPRPAVAGLPGPRSAGAPAPATGTFGLYVGRRWFELSYQGTRRDGVSGLDVTILQTRVLDRLVAAAAGRPRWSRPSPPRTPWTSSPSGATPTAEPCSRWRRLRPTRSSAGRRWRGDAAEDDVLRAEALRRDLPASVAGMPGPAAGIGATESRSPRSKP